MKSTANKAGIVLISNLITASAQAVTLIVLARILHKEILGEVFKLVMIYKTAVILGNLGFSDNPYYFIPKISESSQGRFLTQSIKILSITGLLAGTVSCFFFIYFFGNIVMGSIFIVTITLELMTSMVPDFLVAVGRVKHSSVFNISISALNVVILIAGCSYFENPIMPLTFGFLGYSFVRFVIALAMTWKTLKHDRAELPENVLREQLHFGIPLGLSNLAFRINKQVDNYVVAFFFNSATFAEYTVGSWEIPMILKIPYSITAVYLTKYTQWFDEKRIEKLHEKWLQVGEKVILLLVPITSFFLVFADEFIHMIFGTQFQEAVIVFQIYTLTLYTRVGSYSGLLKAFGESQDILKRSIGLIILNLILNLVFIQLFGLYGAPIGTLTANVIALGLALRKISSVMNIPVSQLLPYSFHLKITAVSLLTAVGIKYMLRAATDSDTGVVLAGACIFIVLFFLIGSLFNLIDRDDRAYLQNFFGFKRKLV